METGLRKALPWRRQAEALPVTPERQRLAEVISTLEELRDEQRMLAAASDPAWRAERDAEAALAAARKAVEAAARASVDHRISVLAGADDAPPPSVEDARREVREAEDRLAAAQ